MPNIPHCNRIIDLFAGGGGLSLGAARAGFEVAAAVEWDKNAYETHQTNFPNSVHIKEDITTLSGEQLLQKAGINNNELIGIVGGPPCQGFSNIGCRNVNDSRNQLFIKFFDLVSEIKPTFFLVENVPGILNQKYNTIREEAFNKLDKYTILPPMEIRANEYGAPTTRTRIFFFGYIESDKIQTIKKEDFSLNKIPPQNQTTIAAALEGLPQRIIYEKNCMGKKKLSAKYIKKPSLQNDYFYSRVLNHIPPNIGNEKCITDLRKKRIVTGCLPTNHCENVCARYKLLEYGQQDSISKSVRLNPSGFCPTLRAGTGPDKGSYQSVRPIHYKYSRVITPREAARLQGFPDWFCLPDTIWHSFRQIGNSVSPIVAERIMSVIFQKLT